MLLHVLVHADMQTVQRWRSQMGSSGLPLYSVGYFENPRWGNEGDFQWHDLPSVEYRIYCRYRRDRHRHPWFVLRNNATREFFMIAPGEARRCPEVHLGLVFGGLDAAVQAMHEHLRQSVFLPPPRGRGGWVEAGIGPELEITPDEVIHAIDTAADIGAELFFVDASWYAPPRRDWWRTVGDWHANLQRFPDGLEPFRERAHAKGMLWGLWMDAERIGPDSQVAKAHPDWIVRGYMVTNSVTGADLPVSPAGMAGR